MSRHVSSSPIVNGDPHNPVFRSTCPSLPENEDSYNIAPGVSTRDVFTWISIGCTVFTFVSVAIIMILHIKNYTKPIEQRHILRILSLPATYAIYNMLSIFFYEANIYMEEIPKIFQAIAIASLFRLFLEQITPEASSDEIDAFFRSLPRWRRRLGLCWRRDKMLHEEGSLRWFKVSWLLTHLYIPIALVLAIAQWIGAATQCANGYASETRKLVLSILTGVFVLVAMYGLGTFERRFKKELNPFGAKGKFWGIRLFVMMSVILNIAFAITQKVFDVSDGTEHMNYDDFTIGLPDVLFEAFMVIFSVWFFKAFSWGRYRSAANQPDPQTGKVINKKPAWRAIFDWVNIWDILKDVGCAFQTIYYLITRKNMYGNDLAQDAFTSTTVRDQGSNMSKEKPTVQVHSHQAV